MPKSTKPSKQTLRDAIRAQKFNMGSGGEDNEDENELTCEPVDAAAPKALKKSTPHQGKSKTFKRKTKRQGRV